jgi:dihydroorotate dehydrogenase (NAD+) catalytic subunit
MKEIRDIAGASRVIWAKLSPDVPDIVSIADAAARSGSDAVTISNSFSGMAIEVSTGKPALGNVVGGVTGAGIKPWVMTLVSRVHLALPELPIVAAGGVFSGVDAVEYLIAGASAVQVGTANFRDPRATHKVLYELRKWFGEHQSTPEAVIGTIALSEEEKETILTGWPIC